MEQDLLDKYNFAQFSKNNLYICSNLWLLFFTGLLCLFSSCIKEFNMFTSQIKQGPYFFQFLQSNHDRFLGIYYLFFMAGNIMLSLLLSLFLPKKLYLGIC